METIPERKCTNCGETKIIHEYYILHKLNSHTNQCKGCIKSRKTPETVHILRKTAPKGKFI